MQATSTALACLLGLLAWQRAESGEMTKAAPCAVQEAPKVLADALCAGTRSALQDALNTLKEAEQPPGFVDVIPILERVWLRDRTLGRGIPWDRLEDLQFRAIVAGHLAQQVRVGRSKLPLRDMQELAIKLSRRDLQDGLSDGIVLIGMTHTPGQVEFLRKVVAASDPSQRSAAISSLGMVCEPEAAAVLTEVQADPRLTNIERTNVKVAISMHARLSERTCRLARGEL